MRRIMITILLMAAPVAAMAQSGRLRLDLPPSIAARASETVDVNLDGVMLRLAAKFLSNDDEPGVRDMASKLEGIYVRSYEFDEPGAYDIRVIDGLRAQLGPEWKRIVSVASKTKENSEIYVRAQGDKINGLVILAAEPRELTIVNIVGPIDLEKLADLEGNFGIPHVSKEAKENKEGKEHE